MQITIDVTAHGPMFDGRALHALHEFEEDAKDDIAAQAYADVMRILNARIKRPTPYYETQIIIQTMAADRVVHDRGIIYGPWLEGVSSRNQTTQFRGYAAFRRAHHAVSVRVPQIVDRSLRRALARMR